MTVRKPAISLNADLGEGGKNDLALMPLVDIANIACGRHAGDEHSIAASVALALEHDCIVSAHPGYPDRVNFGRSSMRLSADEMQATIIEQLDAISEALAMHGHVLELVKPHGALYNDCATDENLAALFTTILMNYPNRPGLIALAGSKLWKYAQGCGLDCLAEGYADRRYLSTGLLAGRNLHGACIEDNANAIDQAMRLANGLPVETLDGQSMHIVVNTICVHGDNPGALQVAQALAKEIKAGLS